MDEFRKRAYKLWSNIKARCYNKKHISYRSYGAKGAKMCDRWLNSFEHFVYVHIPYTRRKYKTTRFR